MIILKNHFENKNTLIYGNVISNGCQTFYIEELDQICDKFDVSDEQKQQVIEAYKQNLNKDDLNEYIETFVSLNHKRAVALATQNMQLIEKLSQDDDCSIIRTKIAEKKGLSTKIIKMLSQDNNLYVRETIAQRPDLDLKILERLSRDDYWVVRKGVAQKTNLPPEMIERLSQDDDWRVRRKIAQRLDLDPKIIERLSQDDDYDVKEAIKNNQSLLKNLSETIDSDIKKEEKYHQSNTY